MSYVPEIMRGTTQYAEAFLDNNTIVTQVPSTATPTNISGVILSGHSGSHFSISGGTNLNRLTYIGPYSLKFLVEASGQIENVSAVTMAVRLGKNGVSENKTSCLMKLTSTVTQWPFMTKGVFSLTSGDYLNVFVQNNTNTASPHVRFLSFTAIPFGA